MFDVGAEGSRLRSNCGAQERQIFCTSPLPNRGRGVRYPWAMAPMINKTKLVATAIATFASTDKFIIFPSLPIMAAPPDDPPFLNFSFLDRFEFRRADGCQA
jgi:hypothetical protein